MYSSAETVERETAPALTAPQRQDFSERCPTPRSRADEVAAKRCKLASVNQVADAFERLGDLDVRKIAEAAIVDFNGSSNLALNAQPPFRRPEGPDRWRRSW